ncbi:MAG: cellobiose phosphorylase [Candidatus Izimaplasma sp.]|nr:cellobiose phosphorylase [Candidatus Izimaplasma bacterium]
MDIKLNLAKTGKFKITNVDQLSYTYFPLCNFKSIKGSITPKLNGSANIDQNSFLLSPITNEDMHNSFMNRNVFFRINEDYTWSITGNTAHQLLHKDEVTLEGDFLTHKITRKSPDFKCVIESFAPTNDTYQELHKITLTNTSNSPLNIKTVVGVPIYSRSADNIRDHRHVTSLLNRVKVYDGGIINKPTFSFDERGHTLNNLYYSVFSHHQSNTKIKHYWPILQEFIGEGKTLLNPGVVSDDLTNDYQVGSQVEGYELTGGFEYEKEIIKPGKSIELILSLMISDSRDTILFEQDKLTNNRYNKLNKQTKIRWEKELSTLNIHTDDSTYNGWVKWVSSQPIFRRLYGNSFLPHHDYGRGGKGWRDLWQDQLALILMNPKGVRTSLLNNFRGVRIDGSNATIIGDKQGEFLADRNNIARVWMDHGSWPLQTVKLYIEKSGDLDLLLAKETYFNDQFTHYTKQTKEKPDETVLKTTNNTPYKGTILEHMLIQNLVPFYNVGAHNNIRIEDADWNDGLDMASNNGESVTFTAFYGGNLKTLATLIKKLYDRGIKEFELIAELDILLQPLNDQTIAKKHEYLKTFFDSVSNAISGKKKTYDMLDLMKRLETLGESLLQQVRANEWLTSDKYSFFNGYYDDDSNRLENPEENRMTLTGQVFPIAYGAATDKQIESIIKSADALLYNEDVGGYRLNTNFKELKTNMGRLFGFAYGHKENGAMFSHMAVMYANALYKRGFVEAGFKVLDNIYQQSIDIKRSKMYPGIPEYFDIKGRGMYPYLTGSASWYILTVVTEVFGIKGDEGYLILEPKLKQSQFDKANKASIKTLIKNKLHTITYKNADALDFGAYKIKTVIVNQQVVTFKETDFGVKLLEDIEGDITVTLCQK